MKREKADGRVAGKSEQPAPIVRTPRLIDVAEAAGVTPSIASRILNGRTDLNVRDETRSRVLAIASEMMYRPNALGRGLKLSSTMSIALITNFSYQENLEVVTGVQRRAARSGYVTLLVDAEEFRQQGEMYAQLLRERRADGFLIASLRASDAAVESMATMGLPVVVMNRRMHAAHPCISIDDARGVQLAVEHLVSLGHTRIGYIGGPAEADLSQRRLAGYRAGIRDAGLRSSPVLIAIDTTQGDGGYLAMMQLAQPKRKPTAIVVWGFGATPGVLAAAKVCGLRVPEDLSVVAFHDAPLATYLDPPVTTVRMPLMEMAERSVETLVDVINGKHPEDVVIDTHPVLVPRSSTAPPPP